MGIGVLWGKENLLDSMPPFLGGGEMILNVTKEGFSTNELPWKFEAGTPMVAEAAGLGAAIDYLSNIGMNEIRNHEIELTDYALGKLTSEFGETISIFGPKNATERGGVISLLLTELTPMTFRKFWMKKIYVYVQVIIVQNR